MVNRYLPSNLFTIYCFNYCHQNLIFRYPYNVIASPAYEISYIHQIFGFFLSACGDIMHDVLMANLMGLFCCQLELLMNKIQNLTDRVQEVINTNIIF